ncbi:MAG: DUF2807 domain-containing protein [Bacteroidales bacterium]|jgi:hypothetical protein|nr:DUF2807 domain-containing protein [Bacteroidales bacterium]
MKKKLLLVLFAVVYSTIFCFAEYEHKEPAGVEKTVKGSGNVVNKLRKVENFDKLDIGGTFNIYLLQGNKESIRVEADDNLHEYILTKVESGVLIIRIKENINFRNPTKANIYVTVKDISEIKIGGVSNLTSKGIVETNSLKMSVKGVSDVNLNINCNYLDIKASGVGDCIFKGKADMLVINSSGTRDINAKKLEALRAAISKSGVGDVSVNVSGDLEIKSSGTGDIIYYGSPVIKSIDKSGVGDIIKKTL